MSTLIGFEKKELTSEVFTKIKDAFKEVNGEHELVFCVCEEKEKEKVEILDTISLTVADINRMSIPQILNEFQTDKREYPFLYQSDEFGFIKVGGQTEG